MFVWSLTFSFPFCCELLSEWKLNFFYLSCARRWTEGQTKHGNITRLNMWKRIWTYKQYTPYNNGLFPCSRCYIYKVKHEVTEFEVSKNLIVMFTSIGDVKWIFSCTSIWVWQKINSAEHIFYWFRILFVSELYGCSYSTHHCYWL